MKLQGIMKDTYKTDLTVDGFDYVMDRSLDKGGEDTGTSPHGFLLSSIAGCKVMVAKGYLDHNKLSYDEIKVEAESDIQGLRGNETIDIVVNLHIVGANLSEKEESHLNRIVERGCTMANILTAGGKNNVTANIQV